MIAKYQVGLSNHSEMKQTEKIKITYIKKERLHLMVYHELSF